MEDARRMLGNKNKAAIYFLQTKVEGIIHMKATIGYHRIVHKRVCLFISELTHHGVPDAVVHERVGDISDRYASC